MQFTYFKALRVSMEEQRARQEQEARRGQASSSAEASTTRPETINESKRTNNHFYTLKLCCFCLRSGFSLKYSLYNLTS